MEGIFHEQSGSDLRYQYNGVESISHSNLRVNLSIWRTLNPAIGRWWQVDPKAEAMFNYSPFNSMADNPISFNDPEGDILPAILIGAGIGYHTVSLGYNFFQHLIKILMVSKHMPLVITFDLLLQVLK